MHTQARLSRAGTAATIANAACSSCRNCSRTQGDCGVVVEENMHASTRGPGCACSRPLPSNCNAWDNYPGCATSGPSTRFQSRFYAAATDRTSYEFPSATAPIRIESYLQVEPTWAKPGGVKQNRCGSLLDRWIERLPVNRGDGASR